MSIQNLTTRQWLDHPLDEVFEFFSRAENLEGITPPWLRFRIVSEHDLTMRVGLTIEYNLRMRGVPVSWQSQIAAWDPPHRFVDEQRRGPYRLWHHEHTFREQGGVTVVEDHVRYSAIGGALVNRLFIAPQLRKIFEYRQQAIGQRFTDAQPPQVILGEPPEEPLAA